MPSLRRLLDAVDHGQVHLPSGMSAAKLDGITFTSVSTDTRTLVSGAVFFALSGPNFDANAMVADAQRQGAVAAVVSRADESARSGGIPVIEVRDTLAALQAWAIHWRGQWNGCVIAVTGSNGKTTVKQMIAAILAQRFGAAHAWATPGNLNNHIGVPLSVSGLSDEHRMAVLELGMNHPDEIAALAAIAQPDVALVNNAQREHQEFMKSVAAVARENGQVFNALPADGVAVFPRDEQHESIWRELAAGRRMIRFGMLDAPADAAFDGMEVTGRWHGDDRRRLQVCFPDGQAIELELRGIGDHFAHNALAACACAHAAGIAAGVVRDALNAFEPVRGRGQRRALTGGGVLVDDSYNANPDSVRAAMDAVRLLGAPRALVLGDMGEVGDQGEAFHREVLHYAQQQPMDALWLHGDAFKDACRATAIGRHCSEMDALISEVRTWVAQQQTAGLRPSVWVKGSRFMKMERVVQALECKTGEVATCC